MTSIFSRFYFNFNILLRLFPRLSMKRLTILATFIACAMTTIAYSQTVLLAHWSFDTDLVTDDSGNVANLTNNSVTRSTSDTIFGAGSADFSGGSRTLTLAAGATEDALPLENNSFTLSYWAKLNNLGGVAPQIFGMGQGGTTGGLLHIGFRNTGHSAAGGPFLGFWADDLNVSTAAVDTALGSGTFNAVDNWYHYTMTYDSSTKEQAIYVNGTLVGTRTATTGFTGSASLDAFVLGSNAFDGLLDEVWVYNNVLTQGQITGLYTANAVPEPSAYALMMGFVALGYLQFARRKRAS